jgi:hypothetical protein
MSDAGRIDQFDGLRAIAFLLVFAFHTLFVPLGFLGVDMFFALSGYLITRNLLALRREETAGRAMAVFYFRRLIRIVPAYFLALAVMLALGQLPGSASRAPRPARSCDCRALSGRRRPHSAGCTAVRPPTKCPTAEWHLEFGRGRRGRARCGSFRATDNRDRPP